MVGGACCEGQTTALAKRFLNCEDNEQSNEKSWLNQRINAERKRI